MREDKYEDIIDLPHHVSDRHPHMSLMNRAAQFAPFAALTGFDASIAEAGRLTDSEEHDDSLNDELNRVMAELRDHIGEQTAKTVTCIRPDSRKSGGRYESVTGNLRKIDDYAGEIMLAGGKSIPIKYIVDLTLPEQE